MRNVHTVRESIQLDDMVKTTQLLLEIIKLHSSEVEWSSGQVVKWSSGSDFQPRAD
jgi:hypothetical protein